MVDVGIVRPPLEPKTPITMDDLVQLPGHPIVSDFVLEQRGLEPPLLRLAAGRGFRPGLRGYDAVHLASALSLTEPVVFASADADLRRAAETEGLALLATAE